MAKTGRNDPCPCGSGKKYKTCCLHKDQEAEDARNRQQQLAAFPVPAEPEEDEEDEDEELDEFEDDLDEEFDEDEEDEDEEDELDVEDRERLEEHMEEFDEADHEGKVALFRRALEEDAPLDGEAVFDMLSDLFQGTVERQERSRFGELVRLFRERRPSCYEQEAGDVVDWLIENAVVGGHTAELPALAQEMARHAGEAPENFERSLDLLDYHGHLAVSRDMLRQAWPELQEADLFDWAVEAYAGRGADYEVFSRLEEAPASDVLSPQLLERLKFYFEELDLEKIRRHLDHLTGKAAPAWKDDDFTPPSRKKSGRARREKEMKERFTLLSVEFLGYLRRQDNVPFVKGRLARVGIREYLLQRGAGELRSDPYAPGMFDEDERTRRRPTVPRTPLCPDRDTLDRFLADEPGHASAAIFELMPAWLRFLEARGLLTAEQHRQTVEELRPLGDELLTSWEEGLTDPAIEEGLARWGEERAS